MNIDLVGHLKGNSYYQYFLKSLTESTAIPGCMFKKKPKGLPKGLISALDKISGYWVVDLKKCEK